MTAEAASRRVSGRHRQVTVVSEKRTAAVSSFALMASACGSGILTFAFWTLIARREGAAVVGAASAEISTITFLAGAASLNMINVFARFLPVAGHRARALMIRCYAAAAIAAAIAATVFMFTPWSASLTSSGPAGYMGFVVLVVLTSVFMIQDGGLIGLGKVLWIPLENLSVGALRLLLLPMVGLVIAGAGGVLASWALATAGAVLVVNILLLARIAPTRQAVPELPATNRLIRFISIEAVTTAISSAVSAFLPAIVTQTEGQTAGGYFYIPWLIATTISLLLMSVLISTVRESVATPGAARSIMLGQLKLVALLVVGAVAVCCLLPQVVLAVLGPDFADQATALLRWIGLSVPGTAVSLLYWSICLIRQHPWPVFWSNLAASTGIIGGIVVFGGHLGITGIGVLYCAVQWITALAVLAPLLKVIRPILSREG